jgi:hypothetical protein
MTDSSLDTERRGSIAEISIDHSSVNALRPALLDAVLAAEQGME